MEENLFTSQRVENFPNGGTLTIDANPDSSPTPITSAAVQMAIAAFKHQQWQAKAIDADAQLSEIGKEAKRAPARQKCVQTITNALASVENLEQSLEQREREFYAWPALQPSDAVAAIQDREIRDYVNSLSSDKLAELTREMNQGLQPAITLALLRSPIPIGKEKGVADVAQNAWRAARNLTDPSFARRIGISRDSVEWAKRNFAHLSGMFRIAPERP